MAVRLLDPDNYYVARANALEGNVRFYKVVDGKREQLAGANIPIASNRWHELILHARGERFTVTFNGEELFSVTDRTFALPASRVLDQGRQRHAASTTLAHQVVALAQRMDKARHAAAPRQINGAGNAAEGTGKPIARTSPRNPRDGHGDAGTSCNNPYG